ncbi:MAG: WD40 repeat domain-containing protein, partial [Pyrinomonadaceae bacterium]|nr:WD40 repeat domain-containing protein [Pyrinomonadaceae bacterium]
AMLDNVKVWNAKTGELVKELQPQEEADKYKKGARNVAFSPDGKYLAASNWQGGTARVWETSTWQPVALLTVESWEKVEQQNIVAYSAAFSPDSTYLIITSDHVSPQVWRVGQWKRKEDVLQGDEKKQAPASAEQPPAATQQPSDKPGQTPAGEVKKEDPKGHTGSVYSVSFSPDGKHVVTGGRVNVAWLWEVGTWKPEFKLGKHASPVYGAGFSHDSKLLVTASYDRSARVWDVATGKLLADLEHLHAVYDAAFSPVKNEFVTSCWDLKVRMWNQGTDGKWKVSTTLSGHHHWIYGVAYSPDGNSVVSGSEDKTARVWRTTDPTELPDSVDALLALARARIKRQLTPEERKRYIG